MDDRLSDWALLETLAGDIVASKGITVGICLKLCTTSMSEVALNNLSLLLDHTKSSLSF